MHKPVKYVEKAVTVAATGAWAVFKTKCIHPVHPLKLAHAPVAAAVTLSRHTSLRCAFVSLSFRRFWLLAISS